MHALYTLYERAVMRVLRGGGGICAVASSLLMHHSHNERLLVCMFLLFKTYRVRTEIQEQKNSQDFKDTLVYGGCFFLFFVFQVSSKALDHTGFSPFSRGPPSTTRRDFRGVFSI